MSENSLGVCRTLPPPPANVGIECRTLPSSAKWSNHKNQPDNKKCCPQHWKALEDRNGKNQVRAKTWRLIFYSFISGGNPQWVKLKKDEFGPEVCVTKKKKVVLSLVKVRLWPMKVVRLGSLERDVGTKSNGSFLRS